MRVQLDDLVPAIRALHVDEFGTTCPFHLSACSRCGGPTWQHPCACCGSWADWGDRKDYIEQERASNAARGIGGRDHFVRTVEAAGGFGAFYFAGNRRVLAYTGERAYGLDGAHYRQPPDPEFVAHVDALVERARGIEWPSPGEIWDRVSGARQSMPEDGYYARETEGVKQAVREMFGADRLEEIQRHLDPSRVNPRYFPENCAEARAALREHARATLDRLGLLPTAPAPAAP